VANERNATAIIQRCDDLGLSLVSGHFYLQSLASAETLEDAHTLGL
jgi:hypothetical protein